MTAAITRENLVQAIHPDVLIFGQPCWNPTYDEFHAWFGQVTQSASRGNIGLCLANAHTFNLMQSRPEYKECIREMDAVLNDGIGFRIASEMRGVKVKYNFNGTDLIPRLFSELDTPLRVYFYGATEESNALAVKAFESRYPNMVCAGNLGGFVSDEEASKRIAESNCDLLLVAQGNPKQEIFIIKYREKLNCKLAIGVGGLFDFMSGLKPRAPKLFRSIGMEWAYRLMIEPRRMFKRYVIGNPVFLSRAFAAQAEDKKKLARLKDAR